MTDPHHTGKRDRVERKGSRSAPGAMGVMAEHPQRWTVNPIEHVKEETASRSRSGNRGRGGQSRTRVRNPETRKQMRSARPSRVRPGLGVGSSRTWPARRSSGGGRTRRMLRRTSERVAVAGRRVRGHRQNTGGIRGGRRSIR